MSPAPDPRSDTRAVELGERLMPGFDSNGLVPCVTSDADSGEVLMLAWMNEEALARTIATGEAHYWSRSRRTLWHKGATSGHTQQVVELRVDCDQDALWLRVRTRGPACHVGYRSCFYRAVAAGGDGRRLRFIEAERAFDPAAVYGTGDDGPA